MGFGNDVGLAVRRATAPSHGESGLNGWSPVTPEQAHRLSGFEHKRGAESQPGGSWSRLQHVGWGTLCGVCPEGSGHHSPLPQSWCVPEPQDKTGVRGGPSGRSRLLLAKKWVLMAACLSQVMWEICEPVFWSMNGRGRSRTHMPSQIICPLPHPHSSPNCRPSTTILKLSCGSTLCPCFHAVYPWGKVCG